MENELALIDVNYICYRSYYGMRQLGANAVAFGVARFIEQLAQNTPQATVAWCFDVGGSKRTESYTGYKAKRRKDLPPEEAQLFNELKSEIDALRTTHLPAMGFDNIYGARGYEADDLIALICDRYPQRIKRVYSSDADLYQLIDDNTQVCPLSKRPMSLLRFTTEYGIQPAKWAWVKAIAGCSSDNIPGVKGVGEKTALKFVRNELPEGSKQRQRIQESKAEVKRWHRLVKLPYEGTPVCELVSDATVLDLRRSINAYLKNELNINEVTV